MPSRGHLEPQQGDTTAVSGEVEEILEHTNTRSCRNPYCEAEILTIEESTQLINSLITKARVEELERLYLVYGSKDKPASLDNIFSLGKKGEVAATPIKDRLKQLKAQLNNSISEEKE